MAEPPPAFLTEGTGQFWWNGTAWVAVSATNPIPVNASVTISPTATQIVAGTVALGAGAANIGTVAVAGGLPATVTLAAGAANIGTVAVSGTSAVNGTVAASQSGTWTGVTIVPSGTQSINGVATLAAGSANIGTVVATGTVSLTGTETVQGVAASGATAAGNPVYGGGRAATADPTAVTDGQAVGDLRDKIGRFINAGFAIPENYLDGFVSSSATTAATVIASQGSGIAIYVTDLEISNSDTTQTVITLNNAKTTQLVVPPGGGREVHLTTPMKIAANTALTFTMTPAVTSVLVGAQGYKGV